VLGRDAEQDVLDHWLQVAAPVAGFVGFAVGRSIWEQPLTDFRQHQQEDRFVDAVAANYLHYANTYLKAR
jgi:myo-inositol catabolism protein IolC